MKITPAVVQAVVNAPDRSLFTFDGRTAVDDWSGQTHSMRGVRDRRQIVATRAMVLRFVKAADGDCTVAATEMTRRCANAR